MVYILYFLMRHISCISLCGVQYIVSPDVAYILFFTHTKHFVIWRTSCNSWCDVLFAVLDVAYNILYRLCGVYIVLQTYITLQDMAYILYFLMWRTFCITWCGVQVIEFPDMAYILEFLMWRISCIPWCGVQSIVSPDVAYILFFTHT